MSDTSMVSIASPAAPSGRISRLIALGLFAASVSYLVGITVRLPRIPDAGAAIDVFLAAVLPSLMVVMLFWAARPAVFPQRRRRALVAMTLLAAAAASILPLVLRAA